MKPDPAEKQLGFFFDQSRCSGCYTCILACRQWHDTAINWRRVDTLEQGAFPQVTVAFLSLSCLHCETPACISACPADALWKRREDGVVLIDAHNCLGKDACGQCLDACPYQAIRFKDEPDAKAEKCDFCQQRMAMDEKPLCVVSCPTRALDAGWLSEIKNIFGGNQNARGFIYDAEVKPAIIFKCKPDKVPLF